MTTEAKDKKDLKVRKPMPVIIPKDTPPMPVITPGEQRERQRIMAELLREGYDYGNG